MKSCYIFLYHFSLNITPEVITKDGKFNEDLSYLNNPYMYYTNRIPVKNQGPCKSCATYVFSFENVFLTDTKNVYYLVLQQLVL